MNHYYIDQFNTLTPANFILKGAGVNQSNLFSYPNPLKNKPGYGWQLVDGEPVQLVDKRGTIYSIANAEPKQWQQLGDIPEGYTTQKPEANQVWNGQQWIYTEAYLLEQAYNNKLAYLNNTLLEKSAFFYSSITGITYRYSTDQEAQLNLTGLVLAAVDCDYICYKDNERLVVHHSAAQLRELGLQITAYKAQLVATHATLLNQLNDFNQAKNIKAIEALSWPSNL